MFPLLPNSASHKPRKGKVTCVTCNLKGCLGRCHFEVVDRPQTERAK
jgi:hypothetical protein